MRILCLEQGDWVRSAEFPANGRDWEARRASGGDWDIRPNFRGRETDYPVNDDNSIMLVVTIAVFWSGLAIAAKRWHDRGKSAWWILVAFVPVIGSLWYLIECGFLKGTTGPNAYGSDPLTAR